MAPIYGWFTEGFDTRDLKEAKALLADLGRNPVELEAFSISKDTKLASNKPALCLIDIELNRERALSETSSIRAVTYLKAISWRNTNGPSIVCTSSVMASRSSSGTRAMVTVAILP